jgi:nucleoside-triphosphatase
MILMGSPGVGKTTVLYKTTELLKGWGFSVGGILSREVREGGVRVGFEVLDLASEKRGWLAQVSQKDGPIVGKYRVNIEDLEKIGARAILDAVNGCDVVVIDEIGPMELSSEKFNEVAKKALDNSKPLIAVVHWKVQDKLVVDAKKRADTEVVTVTVENREKLPVEVAAKVVEFLKQLR